MNAHKIVEPRNLVTMMFGIWLVFNLVLIGTDIRKQIKGEPTFNDFIHAEEDAMRMRERNYSRITEQ